MLCSQNGDRIVAIDYVTSLHPTCMYIGLYVGYGLTLFTLSITDLVRSRYTDRAL